MSGTRPIKTRNGDPMIVGFLSFHPVTYERSIVRCCSYNEGYSCGLEDLERAAFLASLIPEEAYGDAELRDRNRH